MNGDWEQVEARWAAAVEAVRAESTDDAARLRRRRLTFFPLRSVPIAITGVRGAGKSVIYDALADRIGGSYVPRGRSEELEIHEVKTGQRGQRRRSTVNIVPGQVSYNRGQAFTNMFLNGNRPMGVIHVVTWGYDWIWGQAERQAILQYLRGRGTEPDLASLLFENRKAELKFFRDTCDLIRQAWSSRPPGRWLIVAVAKADLYWPAIDQARNYYLPDSNQNGESEFRVILRSLVADLHEGGIKHLAVLPVSSMSKPFDFSESTHFDFHTTITAKSVLGERQRQALVSALQQTVGEFNEK